MRKSWIRGLATIALGISLLGEVGSATAYGANTSGQETGISNINGNLRIGGEFAIQGNWIYYVDPNDGFLRKMTVNGTHWTDLAKDPGGIVNIIVDGDWVFYLGSPGIERVKADGTGAPQLLFKASPDDVSFTIAGDWIFCNEQKYNHATGHRVGGIYKINLNGSEKTELLKVSSDSHAIQTDGSWIYYEHIVDTDNNGFILNRVRLKGTERRTVSKDIMYGAVVYNGSIYCQENNYRIFKMSDDGTKKVELPISGYLNDVGGDTIVYSPRTGIPAGTQVVRASDLSGHHVASTGLTGQQPYILGDWLYYKSTSTLYPHEYGRWGVYECKPNSSQNQELQKDGKGFKVVHVVWN